ncbi:MAG TPA: energy-coupling factor transporter transmembrane component T [Phycisphaerae bacterium]|nr:energy-coupling factor transporter transmembrane component T [Phycisphaerae bacterium]
MKLTPTARGRLAASVLAIAGAVITSNLFLLAAGYIVLVGILAIGSALRIHLKFITVIVLPIAVFSLIVWPLLMGAPPGEKAGTDPAGAVRFALLISLRLAFVGGIIQACVLTIHARDLAVTYRRWGLHKEWLVAALGATVLAPEMKRRAERVYTAALARGLMPDRSIWSRMRVLPVMLIPLTAWSLRSAIHRADNWHERRLLERIDKLSERPDTGSVPASVVLIFIATAWLLASVVLRWMVFRHA